jgi:hypothetical protein
VVAQVHAPLTAGCWSLFGTLEQSRVHVLVADCQVNELAQVHVPLTAVAEVAFATSVQLRLQLTVTLFQLYGTTHLQVKFLCVLLSLLATLVQFKTHDLKTVFHEYGSMQLQVLFTEGVLSLLMMRVQLSWQLIVVTLKKKPFKHDVARQLMVDAIQTLVPVQVQVLLLVDGAVVVLAKFEQFKTHLPIVLLKLYGLVQLIGMQLTELAFHT